MSVISKRFADELIEKEMRDAFLSAQTRAKIALQIRALRSQRGLSQGTLGERMGKPQSNVARLEDREVARYTVTTLLELASAFDVGLVVEFVPYEYFLARSQDLSQSNLQVESFTRNALESLCHDGRALQAASSMISISGGGGSAQLPGSLQVLPSYSSQPQVSGGGSLYASVNVGASSTGSGVTAIVPAAVTTYSAPPERWYASADRRVAND